MKTRKKVFIAVWLTCSSVANASTLAPAEEIVPSSSSASDADLFASETAQLTDAVLANLTDINLTNASLFTFDSSSAESDVSKRTFSSSCKVFPGDIFYPSSIVWKLFDLVLGGGRVIKTVPSAASCYNSWPEQRDANECEYVTAEFTDSYFQ